MSDDRSDWTQEDWVWHNHLMDVLKNEGMEAYCALVDAEEELLVHLSHGGEIS